MSGGKGVSGDKKNRGCWCCSHITGSIICEIILLYLIHQRNYYKKVKIAFNPNAGPPAGRKLTPV